MQRSQSGLTVILQMQNEVKGAFMAVNLKRIFSKLIFRWEYIDRKIEIYNKRHRIQFIEQFLPKNGIGAELGVFKGHLSPILLKHTKATKLHLIDPWYFTEAHWHWANGNKSTVDGLIKVLQTFKKELEESRILIHVGDDWQPEPSHYHHGVYKAVNEFIVTKKYRPVYSNRDNQQWAIKKS